MSKIKGQPIIPITIEEEMKIPKEMVDRIEREALIHSTIYVASGAACDAYRSGAIAEAERAMELVEAATEAMKHMKWNGIEAKFPTYAAVNLEEALARYRAGSGGA